MASNYAAQSERSLGQIFKELTADFSTLFRSEVAVRGEIDPKVGWLIDFADLKRAVDPLVARLDHYLLNEIEGLENPTSELIAKWLWEHLAGQVPGLHCITIEETCTTRCRYFGREGA